MIALIMAGGFGTRFWPESRSTMPKQFLRVVGERSMIQLTVERLLPVVPLHKIFVVTAAGQEDLVKEHLPELPEENIILEPFGMNTAPCIALSVCRLIRQFEPHQSLVVLPADHVIRDLPAFHASLGAAEQCARQDYLVTFGIVPDYPATGYGYIEAGAPLTEKGKLVNRFKEKPDLPTAEAFLQTGKYFWNSGIFYWKLGVIQQAFEHYQPELWSICKEIGQIWDKAGYGADISEPYAKMPKLPIDIAVMEAADKRAVIPVEMDWSDVGSWKALAELSTQDGRGNTLPAGGIALEAKDNYIYTNKFTALIGVENLCIVETRDAILVTTKDKAEEVKKIVDQLKTEGRKDLL